MRGTQSVGRVASSERAVRGHSQLQSRLLGSLPTRVGARLPDSVSIFLRTHERPRTDLVLELTIPLLQFLLYAVA